MSYNIDTWKIQSLRFELPRNFDFQEWLDKQPDRNERGYENVGKRWCVEESEEIHVLLNEAKQTWQLEMSNQSLSGKIMDEKLVVTEIDWRGEGSGHMYHDILLPLFREFHGSVDAI